MLVHRFAIVTAVATYLLILIGGLVHGTGSSLACPDWPTCYGTLMPKMEGGVLVEHSHRLAAGSVVVLTLVLAGLLTATRDPALRRLRGFGWLAVGLVFVQALLGGITVLLRLPTPISTARSEIPPTAGSLSIRDAAFSLSFDGLVIRPGGEARFSRSRHLETNAAQSYFSFTGCVMSVAIMPGQIS